MILGMIITSHIGLDGNEVLKHDTDETRTLCN